MISVHTLRSFEKTYKKAPKHIQEKVKQFFFSISECNSLEDMHQKADIKSITGAKGFYRVRFGDYRVGFLYDEKINEITIYLVSKRGDIYKNFPPK